MDLDQLKGFCFVARLGSFTEAAGKLYLTQPAISLQVKALEKELGEKLFDRVGRKIQLTHSGEVLLKEAEELLSRLDQLELAMRELKGLDRGRVFLGASDTSSIYFLPELLKEFRARHPGLELSIQSLMSREVIRKLNDREIDLGIITLAKPIARIEAVPLFKERFVCICAPEHPFAHRKSVGPHEVAREPLILLDPGSITRRTMDQFLEKAEQPARVVMELSNFEIIKRYVAVGLGISLVPEAAVSATRDGVVTLALTTDLSVSIGVAYRRDRKLSHAARAFLEMAQSHFASRK